MNKIRMRHPDLEQEIQVPASAVPHHGAAGWEVVEPAPAPAPEPENKSTRRRREASNSEES